MYMYVYTYWHMYVYMCRISRYECMTVWVGGCASLCMWVCECLHVEVIGMQVYRRDALCVCVSVTVHMCACECSTHHITVIWSAKESILRQTRSGAQLRGFLKPALTWSLANSGLTPTLTHSVTQLLGNHSPGRRMLVCNEEPLNEQLQHMPSLLFWFCFTFKTSSQVEKEQKVFTHSTPSNYLNLKLPIFREGSAAFWGLET